MQKAWLSLFIVLATLFQWAHAGVVVHKSFKERVLIQGKNATVTITAFNRGPDDITNFVVDDRSFKNMTAYAPVAGRHSRLFKSIAVNESASFWFVVKPKEAGTHQDQPAFFKYKDSNNKQHTGFSSNYQVYPVFTEQEAVKLGLGGSGVNGKWPILVVAFAGLAAFIGYAYQETLSQQASSVASDNNDDE
ncbi:translocon-associated protein beta-domain-containing protein [Chytriomyces cf. hyalinus JEL632]|nr:translocon-associated protein beta-domain-containing protein [Chytriomyces cf. hyalinus JEL632]